MRPSGTKGLDIFILKVCKEWLILVQSIVFLTSVSRLKKIRGCQPGKQNITKKPKEATFHASQILKLVYSDVSRETNLGVANQANKT